MNNASKQHHQFLLELVFVCCLIALDLVVKSLSPYSYANYFFAFSLPLPSRPIIVLAWFLIVVLIIWLYLTPRARFQRHAALTLIIAGGTANTIERAFRGYVTDIIQLSQSSFNLADIYVFIGIGLLLLSVFRSNPAELS